MPSFYCLTFTPGRWLNTAHTAHTAHNPRIRVCFKVPISISAMDKTIGRNCRCLEDTCQRWVPITSWSSYASVNTGENSLGLEMYTEAASAVIRDEST